MPRPLPPPPAAALQPAVPPPRPCLCRYFSREPGELLAELRDAFWKGPLAPLGTVGGPIGGAESGPPIKGHVRMLLVPHGAACDGFIVAAHAYHALAASLRERGCGRLTAILLGTDHYCTPGPPVVASALVGEPWDTPLGPVDADADAAAWLEASHGIPIAEAVHAREHSIENQLPFLRWLVDAGWDARRALDPADAGGGAGAGSEGGRAWQQQQQQQQQQPEAPARAGAVAAAAAAGPASCSPQLRQARLHIVPISVARLPALADIEAAAMAVSGLVAHLEAHAAAEAATAAQAGEAAGGAEAVVVIATSDYTHAGPFYGELPPPGVSLEAYMARQDEPVLQAVEAGDASALLAAAARTRNSMCGLSPLAVALRVARLRGWQRPPRRLCAAPAHLLFPRPDSTGFAAHVVVG